MTIQHLRSSTANKRPTPAAMSDGQLAVNTNTASPGLFFKDSAGALIKVGPVHVGTTAPNASPAGGGETGNTVGEQWLDTTGGTYVFKVWDGSAWRSESGTFVDVNGDVMTGALGIIAGSAGSPGLYFSGDTNTGLYSPGADQVAISTGGSGRLFVNSSGRVSIGTSSFPDQFTISNGGAGGLEIGTSTNAPILQAYNRSGAAYVDLIDSCNNRIFRTGNDSERLRITSAGLVGIGTSSPNLALHVSSGTAAGINNVAILKGGGSSSGNGAGLVLSPDSANTYNTWLGSRVATAFGGASWGCDLVLSTNNNSAADDLTERMRITSAGNVGIGTSSVSSTLHIVDSSFAGNGTIRLGGGGASAGFYSTISQNSDTNGKLLFNSVAGSGSVHGHQFQVDGTAAVTIDASRRVGIGTTSPLAIFEVKPSSNKHIIISASASYASNAIVAVDDAGSETALGIGGNPIQFFTGATERARIDSSGRLLVGTSTSASGSNIAPYAKLQIVGNTAGGADKRAVLNLSADYIYTGLSTNDPIGTISFNDNSGREFAWITGAVDGTVGNNDYPGRLVFSTTADGASSPTERMRINSTGSLTVTATASVSSGTHTISDNGSSPNTLRLYNNTDSNNDTNHFLICDAAASVLRATIRSNGGIANYSANNANLSDRNAKKDISPAADTWNCLKEWEIVNYRYKDQPDDADLNLGVIAQQVAESCPEVITVFQEAKDATETEPAKEERLGVKEQQMYWMAIKALQEAQVRIEALEAKVAALESA